MDVVLPREGLWTPPSALDALHESVRDVDRAYRKFKRWWLARESADVVAAIGTPTSIGSAQVFDGGSLTQVLTVSAAVSAGQLVVVGVASANAAAVSVTFTDSKGNSWATNSSNNATTSFTALGSSLITNALTTSDTITATYNVSEAARMIAATQTSGIGASPFDKAVSSTGTAVGWSTGATAATTLADEIVFAVCANDATAAETDTAGATYTELFDFATSSALNMTMVYKIVSATGAQTGSGTWTNSGSRTWAAAAATYKAAGVAATLPGRRFVRLQAVNRAATR